MKLTKGTTWRHEFAIGGHGVRTITVVGHKRGNYILESRGNDGRGPKSEYEQSERITHWLYENRIKDQG